jgi:Spy/CpxP family protein refolding chaperone
MTRISKTIVAGVAALAMATAVVLPTAPASAGGFGGFHGGGFHGGGFHGGGWGGGGWHGGGWGGRGVWHGGYWRGGSWYNGWWGPAVAAGVLLAGSADV